jgi:hypothetical protein
MAAAQPPAPPVATALSDLTWNCAKRFSRSFSLLNDLSYPATVTDKNYQI